MSAGSSPRAVHEPAYQAAHDSGDGFSDPTHTVRNLGKRARSKLYSSCLQQAGGWAGLVPETRTRDHPLLKKAKIF